MLIVIGIMFLGIAVGYFIRSKKVIIKISDRLIMWAIYLLLFLLGITIGSNRIIVDNLANLGLNALAITIGGIAGSLITAWAGYRIWFKPKERDHAK